MLKNYVRCKFVGQSSVTIYKWVFETFDMHCHTVGFIFLCEEGAMLTDDDDKLRREINMIQAIFIKMLLLLDRPLIQHTYPKRLSTINSRVFYVMKYSHCYRCTVAAFSKQSHASIQIRQAWYFLIHTVD